MHMNEGREEAENNMKKHISAHGEVNGNFTVVFNTRKNLQTLSKNTVYPVYLDFHRLCYSFLYSRS